MKNYICLLAAITILTSCGPAKSVSYSHKFLAADACSVSYSVVQSDERPMIVVTIKSERLVFSSNPTMMLKNFKGEVLKLDGTSLQSRAETSGVIVSNVVIPVTELSAMAEFPVEKKDVDFFAPGISKVRLSTVPLVHEKEFQEDIIGAYLYTSLQKAVISDASF